jgi:cellulose synthase operon protein C
VDALLQRSMLEVDAGKYANAEDNLVRVLRFKPDSAEAHYMRAKVYGKTGATSRQKQELNEAIRLAPVFLQGRLELAQLFLETQAPKSALELLDEAPSWQRNAHSLIIKRNWANLALDDRGALRKGIPQALEIERTADALLQDGIFKALTGEYSGARESAHEMLKKAPDDFRGVRLLAQTYVAQKQPAVAVQTVREYVKVHPNSAPLQQFLGELLKSNGDSAGARGAFVAAKAANPADTSADLALAQVDFSEGKFEDARARLSGVISSKPETISARLLLAGVEERLGNPALATEQLRKVIERDPDNVVALNDLAYLLADSANQPDEGLKLAEKAKEIAPDNPAISDTLGWVLYKKGLYKTAIKHLEYAVAKGPTGRSMYHLAAVYFKLGEQRRGQQRLDEALKIDPTLRPEAIGGRPTR